MFGIHSILNGEEDNSRIRHNSHSNSSGTIINHNNGSDNALSPKKASEEILSTSSTPTILYPSSTNSRSNSSASSSNTSNSLPLKPASLTNSAHTSSASSISSSIPISSANTTLKNSTTTSATSPISTTNKNSNSNSNGKLSTLNSLPRTKISKRYLKDKKFVKLAIRRKSISKKLGGNGSGINLNHNNINNSVMEQSIHNDVYLSANKRLNAATPNSNGSASFSPSTIINSTVAVAGINSTASSPITSHSKLHIKSLEAGLRVKLTLADNLISLYHSLIPFTSKKEIQSIFENSKGISSSPSSSSNSSSISITNSNSSITATTNLKFSKKSLVSKSVQLIDNNLVNLSEYSNKILQQFNLYNNKNNNNSTTNGSSGKDSASVSVPNSNNSSIPTFNNLNTAVSSLFNTKEYSLIRVSRSTTDDNDGSIILKLETCKPGDLKLIDDSEYLDEMLYSLGKIGESPSNLFIKKIIARPRYKSDMKIYLIPNSTNDYSLYTDERMFERDLYNGIIDLEFDSQSGDEVKVLKAGNRDILVTFPFQSILQEYKRLVDLSKREGDEDSIEEEPELEDYESQKQDEDDEKKQHQQFKSETIKPINEAAKVSLVTSHQIATPIPSHIMPSPPPNSSYTTLAPNDHQRQQLQPAQHPDQPIPNRGITLPPISQHFLSTTISSPATPVMINQQQHQQSPTGTAPPQIYASQLPQVQVAAHPISQQLPPQMQPHPMMYQHQQPPPQPQYPHHPLSQQQQQQQQQHPPIHHQQQPYPAYPYYQSQHPSPTGASQHQLPQQSPNPHHSHPHYPHQQN